MLLTGRYVTVDFLNIQLEFERIIECDWKKKSDGCKLEEVMIAIKKTQVPSIEWQRKFEIDLVVNGRFFKKKFRNFSNVNYDGPNVDSRSSPRVCIL